MGRGRILIVDDEQNARGALKALLDDEGYEATEATDGEDALAKIEALEPAIVLSDVRMPRMDGITMLKRAKERGSHAVFVMMTAFPLVQFAVEAMRAGAESYLAKPLDFDAVLKVVEAVLQKQQLHGA